MSYRAMKRLLGETNFELKSLILFGLGLSILAVATFGLYWWRTAQLVDEQTRMASRLLIPTIILEHHWKWDQDEKDFGETIEKMAIDLKPVGNDGVERIEYQYELQ